MLKDMVFARWLAEGCEERSDTLKMVGACGWGRLARGTHALLFYHALPFPVPPILLIAAACHVCFLPSRNVCRWGW